jgi:hypothetical protein
MFICVADKEHDALGRFINPLEPRILAFQKIIWQTYEQIGLEIGQVDDEKHHIARTAQREMTKVRTNHPTPHPPRVFAATPITTAKPDQGRCS